MDGMGEHILNDISPDGFLNQNKNHISESLAQKSQITKM